MSQGSFHEKEHGAEKFTVTRVSSLVVVKPNERRLHAGDEEQLEVVFSGLIGDDKSGVVVFDISTVGYMPPEVFALLAKTYWQAHESEKDFFLHTPEGTITDFVCTTTGFYMDCPVIRTLEEIGSQTNL